MVQVFEADKNVLQGFFYITNVSKALAVEKHLLGEESQKLPTPAAAATATRTTASVSSSPENDFVARPYSISYTVR